MSEENAPRQLLHLVFGGELVDLDKVKFRDSISLILSASIQTTRAPMQLGEQRRR